jgi:hypothetical protein
MLLGTAVTTCRRCFCFFTPPARYALLLRQCEISFTLTAQEYRCIFAQRYYYRASLRPRMPPHSNRSGFVSGKLSAFKDKPDESNFP